jgi:hypothetical protein
MASNLLNFSAPESVNPKTIRNEMEEMADRLEALARSVPNWSKDEACKQMFAIAWDIKQLARNATISHGI